MKSRTSLHAPPPTSLFQRKCNCQSSMLQSPPQVWLADSGKPVLRFPASLPHFAPSFYSSSVTKYLSFSCPSLPTQQLGDLRAPHSCIPRQGCGCLTLCSQTCLLKARGRGPGGRGMQRLGEPSLARPPQCPLVLRAKASVPHHQQTPSPAAPCG